MRWVAVDLEMNQPSNKIIRIGAVTFDPRVNEKLGEDVFDEFVYPCEPIAHEITELTSITNEDVAKADTLPVVLERFWAWSKSATLVCWGRDVEMLRAASVNFSIPYPHHQVVELKGVCQLLKCALPASRRGGGLNKTLEEFGKTFRGVQHVPGHDASNTARIAMCIVQDRKTFLDLNGMFKDGQTARDKI